ncbi:MAG: methionine aminotransferase [Saprospiraceae bacterium]|jgi:methionine aminotransferase|nr:methionine aminotransferase [Saprospiraceae bacterium]
MNIPDKLSAVGISVFAQMGELARKYAAIGLEKGSPDFEMPTALMELSNRFILEGKNQYAPLHGVPVLRTQIANHISKKYQKEINSNSEVLVTSGATQALYISISAFVQSGDEVIIIEPAFETYAPTVLINGGIPIIHELDPPYFIIDWQKIQDLITPKTRMIILNTPHNPTGKTLKKQDWVALQNIVEDSQILILSDEVYESLVFDGQSHQSILRFPQLWHRTLATFSLGKTFHCTGWRIGYLIAPQYLMEIVLKIHQNNLYAPHTAAQYAMGEYLKNTEHIDSITPFYEKKRNLFIEEMKESKFELLLCEGSYHLIADYKNISKLNDLDFTVQLFKKHGVGAIPLSFFYTSRRSDEIVRFCFARKEETLISGAQKLNRI